MARVARMTLEILEDGVPVEGLTAVQTTPIPDVHVPAPKPEPTPDPIPLPDPVPVPPPPQPPGGDVPVLTPGNSPEPPFRPRLRNAPTACARVLNVPYSDERRLRVLALHSGGISFVSVSCDGNAVAARRHGDVFEVDLDMAGLRDVRVHVQPNEGGTLACRDLQHFACFNPSNPNAWGQPGNVVLTGDIKHGNKFFQVKGARRLWVKGAMVFGTGWDDPKGRALWNAKHWPGGVFVTESSFLGMRSSVVGARLARTVNISDTIDAVVNTPTLYRCLVDGVHQVKGGKHADLWQFHDKKGLVGTWSNLINYKTQATNMGGQAFFLADSAGFEDVTIVGLSVRRQDDQVPGKPPLAQIPDSTGSVDGLYLRDIDAPGVRFVVDDAVTVTNRVDENVVFHSQA